MTQSTKDQIEGLRKKIQEASYNIVQQDHFQVNLKIQNQFNLGVEGNQKQDTKQFQQSRPATHQLHIRTSVKPNQQKTFNITPQRQLQIHDLSGSNGLIFQQKEDENSIKLLQQDKVKGWDVIEPFYDQINQNLDPPKVLYKQDNIKLQNKNNFNRPSLLNSHRQQPDPSKIKNPFIAKSSRRLSLPLKFSKPPISNESQSQRYSIFKNNPPKNFYDFKTSAENNVLVDLQNRIIHLPAYMRIKIKKILSLQLKKLSMELNITLIFNIFYGQLPEEIVQVLMEQTSLIFEKQEPMLLQNSKNQEEGHLQTKLVNQKQQKSVKFTIRRKIDVHLDADVRWTPFQVIYPIISVQLPSINWTPKKPLKDQKNVTDWQIRFNLMDYQNSYLKISYDHEQTFGYYRLAPNLIRSMFNNSRVNKFQDFYLNQNLENQRTERQKERIKYFEQNLQRKVLKTQQQDRMAFWLNHCYIDQESQINGQIFAEVQSQIEKKQQNMRRISEQLFTQQNLEKKIRKYYAKSQSVSVFNMANFTIPLYKEPGSALSTIFLPLLLLSIINLAIFFQNADLHDRIASVSLLMLAFVSLIPTLRSQLPPSYEISMVEWMVYVQTYTTVLVLVRSLDILGDQTYTFQIQNQWLFIIACIITGQVALIVLAMMGRYYLFNKPYYNKKPLQVEIKQKFSTHKLKWRNSEFLKELIIKGKRFCTDQELKEKWASVQKEQKKSQQ